MALKLYFHPYGVQDARARLQTAYGILEERMREKTWAVGDAFTLADCAAAPALFYANIVEPFGPHACVAAYTKRLMARPSFTRVIKEAEPYFVNFPK